MAISYTPTPNPNAMKFVAGVPVGGPGTVTATSEPDQQYLRDLIGITGVASVFFTGNFITITKSPNFEWDSIVASALPILEAEFPG